MSASPEAVRAETVGAGQTTRRILVATALDARRTDTEPRGDVAAHPVRVLVATGLESSSAVALCRADAMATALGAELHVLHVVPHSSWLDAVFQRPAANDAPCGRLESPAASVVRLWAETTLGCGFPADRIVIRRGAVASRILDTADELGAVLIVVGSSLPPADQPPHGSDVATKLVRQSRRPVLVARPPTASGAIVAATDFSDDSFPALTRASDLGFHLRAPVTFVHNVAWREPVLITSPGGPPVLVRYDPIDAVLERKRARLGHVASCMGRSIDTVVVSQEDTVDAILAVARALDADLVVVGSHRRRGLARFTSTGTAEAVAATARRCVLSVPMASGARRAA